MDGPPPEQIPDPEQALAELLVSCGLAVKTLRAKAKMLDGLIGRKNADSGELRACANDLSLRVYNVLGKTIEIDMDDIENADQ